MQKMGWLGFFVLLSCTPFTSTQDGIEEQQALIEFSDLYSAGHEQVEAYLATRPELGPMLDSNLAATLLINLTIEYEDGEKERIQQSGCFILNGEYILTAGHGFYVESAKLIELEAQTISRHIFPMRIISLGYSKDDGLHKDWAILQPLKLRPTSSLDINRSVHRGSDALLLGYPGGFGLDDSNRVVHALEVVEDSVYPLALVCERSIVRPNMLTPQVGAIPIRGMSGAPVLSKRGELIGLFSSISRTRGVNGWHYIFHMSDIPFQAIDSLMIN